MIDLGLITKGLVIFAAIISVGYVFARITQSTGSFTKGILAVSILIDFYLIILWILGIDRPLFQVKFTRIGASITITALTMAIPIKLIFTIYIFIKSKQLQAAIG